ncbi:uncharacterized protein [Amphiura filiformis]|uniref:uncharacterized protein n=1 Tax=Amphiura filiformis TaxID=82378 RepID=UPI003B21B2E5
MYKESQSLQGMLYTTPDCFSCSVLSFGETRDLRRVFCGLKDVLTPAELKALRNRSEKENIENSTKKVNKSGTVSKDKWVVNLSSKQLTSDEVSVLEKGLNFAADNLPINDVIVATESACKDLPDKTAAELRARVVNIVKTAKPPASNITRGERSAINNLRKDENIEIIPADKGRATVVIDKTVYEEKALALLSDDNVYSKLKKDPTQIFQARLVKLLKELKDCGTIDSKTYWKLYPTVCDIPKFYGLIKVHKAGAPLRPIVSSIGSVSYELARFVADIISPLIGQTVHHIKNTQTFVDQVRDLVVHADESLISFDVTALFTSIPVKDTLNVIKHLLENDNSWQVDSAENLSVDNIIQLLSFCLNTTYFVFRGQNYQQKDGCAMGSPCSPLAANAYMEHFERIALASAPHTPRTWYRYVDDTFCVIKSSHVEEFTNHINSQDTNIKFTREEERDGQLAFLDTLIYRKQDGSVKIQVYRKPTHTDQYLNFSSHHPLEHKLSVVRTLLYRAETVVTDPDDKSEEIRHVKEVLHESGYKDWTLFRTRPKPKEQNKDSDDDSCKKGIFVTLPYVEGLSERLRRVFNSAGVSTSFKPQNSLRRSLVSPKDKTEQEKQSGVVYSIPCKDCDSLYIGESGRKLEKRLTEHKSKAASSKSAIKEHIDRSKGHQIDWET